MNGKNDDKELSQPNQPFLQTDPDNNQPNEPSPKTDIDSYQSKGSSVQGGLDDTEEKRPSPRTCMDSPPRVPSPQSCPDNQSNGSSPRSSTDNTQPKELFPCSGAESTPPIKDVSTPQDKTTPPPENATDFLFTPPNQPTSTIHNSEDDNLKFIKEQLNFLNNESGELATPIHKSNKQKRLELAKKHQELAVKRKEFRSPAKQFLKLQSRGLKRSPQKIKPRKAKRVRRSIGFTDKSPDKDHNSSGADADTSDDSSSGDNWKIIDSSDNEIDKALEENACKQNLSVVNVKNILHQVITNEDVVAMVKNTLHELTEETSDTLLPATYEPKMTRSKFKEVLEKDGTIHHPWPLSPLKKMEKPKTTFLELPLPDDDEEEDDEYNPDKEIEQLGSYSDEDSESVTSSQVSEFGSPRPSTPATPTSSVSRFSDLDKTPSIQGDEEHLKSPMGPPSQLPVSSKKSMLGKRFHSAMAESDKKAKQKEEETIALRTRSKLSLTETSLIELESSFVAPDITWDMYDTSCDDKDWMTFLTGLQKFPENEDTNDDDNDPEYNYLAEAEEEEIDMEDFRCDRAVQVSRKEMNELMDELLEAYQETDILEDDEKEMLKQKVMDTVKTTSRKQTKTSLCSSEIGLTESQKIQLDHQMRKHVQLLAQMFVLSSGNTQDYQEVKDNSKFLLNEIHKFSQVNSSLTTFSAYKSCNLEEAVALVNDDREYTQIDPKNILVNNRRTKKTAVSPSKRGRKSCVEKDPSCLSPEKGIENMLCRNYKHLSERKKDLIFSVLGNEIDVSEPSAIFPRSTLPILTTQQKDILWNSLIFIYPELIPHGSFLMSRDFAKSPRVCFTDAEDNLLALGFEQFRNLPFYRKLIQKFMLPCKTEDQIKIRIKNLMAKTSPDNPVKTFKNEKKLPDFTRFTEPFDLNGIKSIKDQNTCVLPVWCKEMKIREIILTQDDQIGECFSAHRSKSVNIPVCQTRLNRIKNLKSRSAPATPLTQPVSSKAIALKVLQFGPVTSAETRPSSPKVTQLQDIGRKLCSSPGFVKLHEDSHFDFNSNYGRNTPVDNVSTDSQGFPIVLSEGPSSSSHVTLITSGSIGQLSSSSMETGSNKSSALMIMHGQTPATCAAPNFVVVNKTANANLTGHVDSTVLSSALPSSICSVVRLDVDNSNKVVSPTKLINDTSREVQNEFTPPRSLKSKCAVDIVASYAPYYLSPELVKDVSPCLSQQMQELTPTKKSPSSSRYRPVAPKPIVLSTFRSPVKKVSPFLEKKVKSPRRKQLQTKALSIRPKGFVPNKPFVSPSKKAASNIINKALKRPKTLLPKPFGMMSRPLQLHVRKSREHEEEDISYLHEMGTSGSEGMDTDYMSGDCIDTMDLDEYKICNQPSVFSKRQKHNSGSNRSIESDDTQSEADDNNLYDSQNEDDVIDDEDHLADLMTASTTICFASQRQNVKDKENRRKGMNKKDATLAMLAPDLLEADPHKDDRDTALAQAYLNRTKEALKTDTQKYEHFLRILYDFGKSEQSPVKLYQDLQLLLADYPDLVSDFAGFLLPEQAIECGCIMASQEFKKAKMFLRKLEVYLARHPSHFQKVMKIFSRWSQSDNRNVGELRQALEPILKIQPHLLEELSLFFEDERPPESYMTDYEEITLDDSDNEPDPDGYELIELPDEQDINGTKMCQCNCHKNTPDQNYLKRNRHCYSCCLKVIDGELYFRVSNKVLKKVNVTYHKPIRARETQPAPSQEPTQVWEDDDDDLAEKENVDISLLPKVGSSKKKKDKRNSGGSSMCAHSDDRTRISPAHFTPVQSEHDDQVRILSGNSECSQDCQHLHGNQMSTQTEHQNTNGEDEAVKESEQNIKTKNPERPPDEENGSHYQNISGNQTHPECQPVTCNITEPITNSVDQEFKGDKNITNSAIEDNECSGNKSVQVVVLSEEANSSPSKGESLHISSSSTCQYTMGESSTCPDILAKALKVAMISQGDVSMDISFTNDNQKPLVTSSTVFTNQTQVSPMLSSGRSEKHFVKELFGGSCDSLDVRTVVTMADEMSNIGIIPSLDPSDSNIISTMVRTEDSTMTQTDLHSSNQFREKLPTISEKNESSVEETLKSSSLTFKSFGKDLSSVEMDCPVSTETKSEALSENSGVKAKCGTPNIEQDLSRSNSRLSETRNIESPKSIISITHPEIESSVIGFCTDSNGSNSLHQNQEINRLTPRRTAESTSQQSKSPDTWNKESDRIILEAVKSHGPGTDTFNEVAKTLPGKTPHQISQRFHQLLEILSTEEVPSEEDTEDDKHHVD